jgi:AraC family transcriptional regulator of adaptative response / DNA-3-methyladenine glycosylase II
MATPEFDLERDRRAIYAAAERRDNRLDGRLFVGVRTTGIYCRSISTAQMPKFGNCTFYAHPASAEKAGLRPCLVCRPELAPGDAKVDSVSKLVRLVLRRIEDGALNGCSVADLAAEFGVDARDICRATTHALGVTPTELAQTQRLLQAKQLLTETDLSIAEVALAAGFGSARSLSSLFKTRYRLNPSSLRRIKSVSTNLLDTYDYGKAMSFRIDYRPPFNWDTLLMFLGERAIPGVEAVHDGAYLRTVQVAKHVGWIAVTPYLGTKRSRPVNALRVLMSSSLQPVCLQVLSRVKTVFDTRANAAEIDRHLAQDSLLAPSIDAYFGMRLPGAFEGFELLLRAILGQQVSVKGATTLAGRMVQAFGVPMTTPWPVLTHLSPEAGRIARADIGQIARIGMPGKRAEAIRLVAQAAHSGELNLVPGADPDVVREQLLDFPGIGEWTASYVAMRVLAWSDAFPLGDLGIKKALGMTRASDIMARTDAWRPWRAYAAIYLWLSLSGG